MRINVALAKDNTRYLRVNFSNVGDLHRFPIIKMFEISHQFLCLVKVYTHQNRYNTKYVTTYLQKLLVYFKI